MFIPVDLKVGEIAVGVIPGIQKSFGISHIKAIKGKVLEIKKIMHSYGTTNQNKNDLSVTILYKEIDFTATGPQTQQMKKIKLFDYRIVKFSFGGIMMPNPTFDGTRIEKEEGCKLDPNFINWI